jgi:hypothetical protein
MYLLLLYSKALTDFLETLVSLYKGPYGAEPLKQCGLVYFIQHLSDFV